jgi:hypothetical protein
MKIELFMHHGLAPALSILPPRMNSTEARALVLAICLQESGGLYNRLQIGGGPARGYPQFERGNEITRGGIFAVMNHPATRDHARALCVALDIPFKLDVLYEAIAWHDILAAGLARLLLWADPNALPRRGEIEPAWLYYLRCWQPGKPRHERWGGNYALAWGCV